MIARPAVLISIALSLATPLLRPQDPAPPASGIARFKDEIEVRVEAAYNKLERTRQMVGVSEQLLALRVESHRVTSQQFEQRSALASRRCRP